MQKWHKETLLKFFSSEDDKWAEQQFLKLFVTLSVKSHIMALCKCHTYVAMNLEFPFLDISVLYLHSVMRIMSMD